MTDENKCRKCGGDLQQGYLIAPGIYSGIPDFPEGESITISEGPSDGTLRRCSKCVECGHSFLPGNGEAESEIEIHECATCEYAWEHGKSGAHNCSDILLTKIEELKQQVKEADTRAGDAERRLSYCTERHNARTLWLDKAKREAGYEINVSFDVVWAEALAALLEKRSEHSHDEEG